MPSSALLEDIKKLTDNPSQVIAIFSKDNLDKEILYSKVCHVAKGVNLKNVNFPEQIQKMISLYNYVPKNIIIKETKKTQTLHLRLFPF